MPTLADAFDEYMKANPSRSKATNQLHGFEAEHYLGDWLSRPLDTITRRDVGTRLNKLTTDRGGRRAAGP